MHTARCVSLGGWFMVALGLVIAGCAKTEPAKPKAPPLMATLDTSLGAIEIELLPDVAPKTVENFRLLAQRGYFNGLEFFRIVPGFMVQTGDPLNNGKGGKSAWGGTFADEIDKTSPLYRDGYKRGSVAMANYGKDTNTSQFFIVQKDYPLNAGYTIFGRVTKGMEVVDKMMELPLVTGIDGMKSKPMPPPVIKTVTITGGKLGK